MCTPRPRAVRISYYGRGMSGIVRDVKGLSGGSQMLLRALALDPRVLVLDQEPGSGAWEITIHDAAIVPGTGQALAELQRLLTELHPYWREHLSVPGHDALPG